MSPTSSRIVLLGHTGFIGTALLEHFAASTEASVLGLASSTLDLTHPAAQDSLAARLDSRTTLIVAAAQTRDRRVDDLDIFDANLAMALNVARVLTTHPVQKCVYFSTVSVYGESVSHLPLREDTPVAPATYYAAAKYAGECLLQQVAHAVGFPLLILRPCRVVGPGARYANDGPLRLIQSILQDDMVWLYGDGQERRDHLYIDDFVRMVAHLVGGEYTGVYNLASGQSHSYQEILAHLHAIVRQDFEVCSRPRTQPLIHQHFDISKLLRAMPQCQFTPLPAYLQATYDYFASQPCHQLVGDVNTALLEYV